MLHIEIHFQMISREVISPTADRAHIKISLQSDIHLSGQYL